MAAPMITPEETAELERLLAEASPGPWAVRSQEYDDWGCVRGSADAEGCRWPVAHVKAGRFVSEGQKNDHRRAGTDPYEHNTALIVFLRNHASALLAAARQAKAKDARIAELEAENRTLQQSILRQEHAGDPCPFVNPRFDLDLDEPCPVCGDLGTDSNEKSNCVTLYQKRAARLADPSPNAGGGGAG